MSAPMPPAGDDLDLGLARPWPDGVPDDHNSPNAQGMCSYCFWPMQGDCLYLNGAYAHTHCVAEHELLILGEDAMPGLLEHLDYLDDLAGFLDQLSRGRPPHGHRRRASGRGGRRACHG